MEQTAAARKIERCKPWNVPTRSGIVKRRAGDAETEILAHRKMLNVGADLNVVGAVHGVVAVGEIQRRKVALLRGGDRHVAGARE